MKAAYLYGPWTKQDAKSQLKALILSVGPQRFIAEQRANEYEPPLDGHTQACYSTVLTKARAVLGKDFDAIVCQICARCEMEDANK